MAYVGASPANRALTSADIAPGSVTLNDINFTDTPTNMNITGVINKHTMRLAEGVTVTGDVTISDNLILSKISDDGVGITLTNDSSTRTITGSGSIEASTLAQTPNASLTGMTGTVGSGVTGSPNLNLGNATFPAGMVLKEQAFDEVATIVGSSTTWASGNTVSFTKLKASADSYLVYIWNGHIDRYPNSGSFIDVRMGYTPSGGSIAYTTERQYDRDYNIGGPRILDPMCFQQYFSSFNAGTHTFVMQCRWGGGTNNNSQLVTDTDHYVFIKEVSK